jgi:FAD binding domain
MSHIAGVVGAQYLPTDKGYETHQEQYASSSYQKERDLAPGLIVLASNLEDIQLTVQDARKYNKAVAIRTGGHQYSGASSTGPQNIQLDLSNTFRSSDDLKVIQVGDKQTFVRTSVSWSLGEFIDFLSKNHLFVPTGQCTDVHLGGHAQTGGYGQLARSFGLLGDHVISLELVPYDGGPVKEVNKKSDPDWFYALLGGSPGNLGVLTHFTLEVHRDSDYDGSLGLLAFHFYSREKLNRLLDILVAMSDDDNFPRNYDLCISVQSQSWKLDHFSGDLHKELRESRPELFDKITGNTLFAGIAVYAQWVKLSPNDTPDMDWFNKLNDGSIPIISKGVQKLPMSEIVKLWLFTSKREFNHPYVKRTLVTNSSSLGSDGWASWISNHIDEICTPENGLFVSAQLQCAGGKFSKLTTNAGNGTAYSWRDSRLGCTIDCFHDDDQQQAAEDWEEGTDKMIGPNGVFAKQERRLLWGSFGDWNMENVWQYYYESKDKYQRLQKIRGVHDPDGTFTPNPFCVPRG